ncbi:hypothetical protein SEA_KING2_55 [Arthrobacter phage King2]|uniref:Uncharacterized protein n=1 Tax=Arthrobacter phage King2 TaxID=2762386 RepID=A0A7G8LQV3_9CAUD|nr:hypothetical protein SEA_KING2_55 [Arthrobacter phage King2]
MATHKPSKCSNCGESCTGRDELAACNRCLPIVRAKRKVRDSGGWAQCLVTIAKTERWFAYDRAARISSNR